MSTAAQEPYLKQRIDYTKAVTRELVARHKVEWEQLGKKLVSAILFGPLAADEWSEEIWLLEIVKGYPYPSRSPEPAAIKFKSTRQFPMFGHLRLWVWSPEEFHDAVASEHPFIAQIRSEPKEFIVDASLSVKKSLG